MLKKKDLVKEFELVVRQEIVEHNKAISASNLAVNELREKVLAIPKILSKEINELSCANIRLSHDQEGIFCAFKKVEEEFVKLQNDQFILNERNHKEIQSFDNSLEAIHGKYTIHEMRINSLDKSLYSISKGIKLLIESIESEPVKTINKIDKAIKKLKKEILSIPSKSEKVRDEFMEELSMHKIDNEGLLKEIKVLKKTVFINEKKIEHLNTLIQRMYTKIQEMDTSNT